MKFMEEHNAIGIYICYRFIQFIVNLYDGYIIYAFYLFIFVTMAYYCFSNKTRLLEMTHEWKLSEIKTRALSFLLGKLMSSNETVVI